MTGTIRRQSIVVNKGGTPVPVDTVSWEHGVNLKAGDVVGSQGNIAWADGVGVITGSQIKHPLKPGWDNGNGTPITVDVTDDGVQHRVFTGQIESSTGGALTAGVQSKLTDWIARLNTKVKLPPLAFRMPKRYDVPTGGTRMVGLWGVWYTHLAMAQAGFHPCQGPQRSTVWYQSFCGSAQTFPNPDHATDTLGHITTIHRIGDPNSAPVISQGRNLPVMSQVYCIGSTLTRRNSSSPFWQVTVDMADLPAADQEGYVDLRPLPLASGYGFRLSWDKDFITVWVVDAAGVATDMLIRGREQAMRWSLIIDPVDDWYRLINDEGHDSGWHVNGLGTALPTGGGQATVIVNSPGPISAVGISRSDSNFLVDQAVSAQIFRSTFVQRSLPGFDYLEPTPALEVLADQADAERSLLGLPLLMWINKHGQLVQADPAYYAAKPITRHFTTNATGTALDDVEWFVEPTQPVRQVDVRCRFGQAVIRPNPTILLNKPTQRIYDNGDSLEEPFMADPDQTWLQPDQWAYLAGHPMTGPAANEFNKAFGTWVGGMETDDEGDRIGWITLSDVTGWTMDASDHVQGALELIDHRTFVYKGTVAVGSGKLMSSMPDQGSVSLFEWRKQQALPQIRGRGRIDWTDRVTSVEVTGDERHEVLEHDGGMWVQNSVWRKEVADILAAAYTNPAPELKLTVAVDPSVEIGEHATATVNYTDGAVLEVEGLVVGIACQLPSDRDQMTVRMVVLNSTWTPAGETVGTGIDFAEVEERDEIGGLVTTPPTPLPEDEE